ncbi:MAG: cyclase family protein [Saprospiraceae bacterium]|nr:cyclase family protein [Saprospiraceae bacterium]
MKQYIDLSHVIEGSLITYKGLPPPVICDYLSREASKKFYAEGTTFQIGKIEMVGNTGTYIDCPFHRYEDGKDLAQAELKKMVNLPAVLIRAPYQKGIEIGMEFFRTVDIARHAVIVHTGWADFWNTDRYYSHHPFLSAEAARYLLEQEVLLVGIDSHNIDDTRIHDRPVHSILLKNEILIVEHLCDLDKIPVDQFLFSAVPPKIKGMGTFPVRAFATVDPP